MRSMQRQPRTVLLVGVDDKTRDRLAPALQARNYYEEVISDGQGALAMLSLLPYDAVLVSYPLLDTPLQPFIAAVRTAESPCRHAAVVLLATRRQRDEAESYLGRGVNTVFCLEDPPEALPRVLDNMIDVAPRHALRTMSRLEIELKLGTAKVLCQTENLSMTGMLIRTDQAYPVGSKFTFELTFPGDRDPIRGRAEIVRHTLKNRERITGVAARFLPFPPEDQRRLETHLARLDSPSPLKR